MRVSFSTDQLEAAARFEHFRDTLVRNLFQLDLVSRTEGPYRGKVDLFVGGPAIFGQVYGSEAEFHRSPGVARRCEEGVWLLLNRNGRMLVDQEGVQSELAPGDGVIFNAVRSHAGCCAIESDTWVVQIPDTVLRALRAKDAATTTLVLPGTLGVTRLITNLLEAHEALAGELPGPASLLTAQYLADLVVVAMGADRDGSHVIENRGLKAARLQAVLKDIWQHYLDAGFGAESVARRLGMTPRYVHLLLEETGRSFSEHVLERRLCLAQRLLSDPHRAGVKISDIAYECGFSDLSYFNRTFRRRFGMTPSEMRAAEIRRVG